MHVLARRLIITLWFCVVYTFSGYAMQGIAQVCTGQEKSDEERQKFNCLLSMQDVAYKPEVLDFIMLCTTEQSRDIRAKAASILGWTHMEFASLYQNDEVIAALTTLLNDSDEGVRATACESLASHGYETETYERLTKVYREDESTLVKECALSSIARIGPIEETGPLVLDALQDTGFRLRAVNAVEWIGAYPEIVQALCAIIDDSPPAFMGMGVTWVYPQLQLMGTDAREAIPIVISVIERGLYHADLAVQTLPFLDNTSPEIVKVLTEILTYSNDTKLLKQAIIASGRMESGHAQLMNPIMQFAKGDPGQEWRSEWSLPILAVNTLGEYYNQKDIIIPVLRDILRHYEGTAFAINIDLALWRLGDMPQWHRNRIFKALYSKRENILHRALWACGELGPEAKLMLPRILELVLSYMRGDIVYEWDGVLEKINPEYDITWLIHYMRNY